MTQTLCERCDLFGGSLGEVLCAAKDEICVDIIRKGFACTFMRESRI
jgi:hypothetical protein